MDSIKGLGTTIGDMFINLSSEYPELLDGVLLIFAVLGVFIVSKGILDIVKLGNRQHQVSPGGITAKLIGGASLVDLSLWARAWSGTVWMNSNPLGISEYSASGGGGYSEQAIMAALGIMVITGYVTLGRAYLGIAKMGALSPESRSDMIGKVVSRIIAGTALISSTHIARAISNSTGISMSIM